MIWNIEDLKLAVQVGSGTHEGLILDNLPVVNGNFAGGM